MCAWEGRVRGEAVGGQVSGIAWVPVCVLDVCGLYVGGCVKPVPAWRGQLRVCW